MKETQSVVGLRRGETSGIRFGRPVPFLAEARKGVIYMCATRDEAKLR
jgi:hypothetical protein